MVDAVSIDRLAECRAALLAAFRGYGRAAVDLYSEDAQVAGLEGSEKVKIFYPKMLARMRARDRLRVALVVWEAFADRSWGECCCRCSCPSFGVPEFEGLACPAEHRGSAYELVGGLR